MTYLCKEGLRLDEEEPFYMRQEMLCSQIWHSPFECKISYLVDLIN